MVLLAAEFWVVFCEWLHWKFDFIKFTRNSNSLRILSLKNPYRIGFVQVELIPIRWVAQYMVIIDSGLLWKNYRKSKVLKRSPKKAPDEIISIKKFPQQMMTKADISKSILYFEIPVFVPPRQILRQIFKYCWGNFYYRNR